MATLNKIDAKFSNVIFYAVGEVSTAEAFIKSLCTRLVIKIIVVNSLLSLFN